MKRQGSLIAILVVTCLAACSQDSASTESQTPAERGMAFVTANACTACHALDGTRGIGPSWVGIYGTTRTFKDGRSANVDDAYLRRAMLDPAADVVEGFESVMVPAPVSEAQIADIIALIKELREPQ